MYAVSHTVKSELYNSPAQGTIAERPNSMPKKAYRNAVNTHENHKDNKSAGNEVPPPENPAQILSKEEIDPNVPAQNDESYQAKNNALSTDRQEQEGILATQADSSLSKLLRHPHTDIVLALGSAFSAVTDFVHIPKPLKHFVDRYSVVLIKAAMIGRYFESGLEALKKNRIVESAGRLMGIIALPLVKLNDLAFASGLGEFIPQIDLALEGKVAQRKALVPPQQRETKLENAKIWINSLKEAYSEISAAGLSPDRKIFPRGKDEGHTLVTAGTITFLSSILGVLFARKDRGLVNKIFGLGRTTGSLTADYTLLTHPDARMRKTGKITTANSIIDFIQRFLPERFVNSVNHLNLILAMFANRLLTDRSHLKSKDEITTYNATA